MSDHRKPVRLAAAALTAGIDANWETASHYVQRINDECGPDALPYALMGWVDTLADHATDGAPIAGVASVSAMNYDTGELDGDIPPEVRWGNAIVKARADMDEAAFTALIKELDQLADHETRGAYVGSVLQAAALTIRGLPRGYARMGRSS